MRTLIDLVCFALKYCLDSRYLVDLVLFGGFLKGEDVNSLNLLVIYHFNFHANPVLYPFTIDQV